MVEHNLAKVGVAGSSPVSRSVGSSDARGGDGATVPASCVPDAGVAKLARREGLKIPWAKARVGSIPTPGTSKHTDVTTPAPASLAALLAVAGGGALGATARHLVTLAGARLATAGLPWPTLAINLLGSFALGWFVRWADATDAASGLRLFVAVGLCGGFTTFSTFAVETLALLQGGQALRAAIYLALSLLGSVAAAAAGFALRG